MNRAFRAIFTAIVLTVSFAAPAAADPFETATAASSKGDHATALRLLRPLADKGHAGAQRSLGEMYADGRGAPQDDVFALMWLNLSLAQSPFGSSYRDLVPRE